MAQVLEVEIKPQDSGLIVDVSQVFLTNASSTSFLPADVKKPFAILLDTVTNVSTRYPLAVWTKNEIAASTDVSFNGNGQAVGALKTGDNIEISGLVNGRDYIFTQIGQIAGNNDANNNVFSTAKVVPVGPSDQPVLGEGVFNESVNSLTIEITLGKDNGAFPFKMRLAAVDASNNTSAVQYLDQAAINTISGSGKYTMLDASFANIFSASSNKTVTVTASVLTSTDLASPISVREYSLEEDVLAPTGVVVTDVTEFAWDYETDASSNKSVKGQLEVTWTAGAVCDTFEVQSLEATVSGSVKPWVTKDTVPYDITKGTDISYNSIISVAVGSLNTYRVIARQAGAGDGISDSVAAYDEYNPALTMNAVEVEYTNDTKLYNATLGNHNVNDYSEFDITFVTGESSYVNRDISLDEVTYNRTRETTDGVTSETNQSVAYICKKNALEKADSGVLVARAFILKTNLHPNDVIEFDLSGNESHDYTGHFTAGAIKAALDASNAGLIL